MNEKREKIYCEGCTYIDKTDNFLCNHPECKDTTMDLHRWYNTEKSIRLGEANIYNALNDCKLFEAKV